MRVELDYNGIGRLFNDPNGPMAEVLEEVGEDIEVRAKAAAPVRSGRLKGSITHEVVVSKGGLEVQIGSDLYYALYVEMGTSDTRAQPFLRSALGAKRA
jgi:HK97 gp10 family phage protein